MATLAEILTSKLLVANNSPVNSTLVDTITRNRGQQEIYTKEALVKLLSIKYFREPYKNRKG